MNNLEACVVPPVLESVSIPIITSAALVDSINPCAIAVLLILLGSLLTTTDNKRAIITGLSFTIGLFIAYFLAGLGLFHALSFAFLAKWIHLIIGILAILIGLSNIKDFFWYGGGGFVTEIPNRWRPSLKSFLKKITSPLSAFFAGFIVIFFELPCTGGPYLFTIGYMATLPKVSIIPILLYYNLIFVLPLIIITALIYFGYSNIGKATDWKDKNIRLLHLISGIIMLVLGIWIITN